MSVGFALATIPAKFPITKSVWTPFPENPKTLILQHCKTIRDLNQVHAHLIKTRFIQNPAVAEPFLESAAILMADPAIEYARSIFLTLECPEPSAYTVMIRGFNQTGSPEKSILLFRQMIELDVKPDEFTFPSILKACSKVRALSEGEQIHSHIVKVLGGFEGRAFVENALVYMYASCGCLKLARRMFDKMFERSDIAWNSLLSGYVRCCYWKEVVALFREMLETGLEFNEVTLTSVLMACGRVGDLEFGEWVYEYAKANVLLGNANLVTSVVDMYAKCGRIDIARQLFDDMHRKDVVAWSAMISGYSQSGHCIEALALFRKMQNGNVKPNEVTMVGVLSSCAVLGALETGKWVHSFIKKNLRISISLGTTLIDFYAKCGCMNNAMEVFKEMPLKNVWSWTALIQGFANSGNGNEALRLYNLMLQEMVEPNDVTFVGVLCACSHAGLIDEGRDFFHSMKRDFGIEPKIEHYGCLVDILSRAGLIEDAYNFIKHMNVKPNAVIWRTLLASCRVHKKVEIGEEAFKHVVRLEPAHSGDYILLSNLYASVGKLEDAKRIRNHMKLHGTKKNPGCSYIELDGVVNEFLAEDKEHPQSKEIYDSIENIIKTIKKAGYVADTLEARLEAEEDEKEISVSHHSEKLAVAFGLINTSPGTTIRISKNLRICSDCHNAMKLISKVFDREIVIRDRNRFHHFQDGLCSCNDFW